MNLLLFSVNIVRIYYDHSCLDADNDDPMAWKAGVE